MNSYSTYKADCQRMHKEYSKRMLHSRLAWKNINYSDVSVCLWINLQFQELVSNQLWKYIEPSTKKRVCYNWNYCGSSIDYAFIANYLSDIRDKTKFFCYRWRRTLYFFSMFVIRNDEIELIENSNLTLHKEVSYFQLRKPIKYSALFHALSIMCTMAKAIKYNMRW